MEKIIVIQVLTRAAKVQAHLIALPVKLKTVSVHATQVRQNEQSQYNK